MLALPPYATMLGVRVERDGPAPPRFILPFAPDVTGWPGFLHGGAIAGLLEIAAIGTLSAALEGEGRAIRIKPVTVTVDYMRGGREHDTFAAATISRLGSRIANVEAFAWQEERERPIAAARMNLVVERASG